MLVFTEEQMVRADAKARVHFHRRVRDYIRENMPKATRIMPNTRLLAYIGEQDRIAAEYEITTELGVTKWVCLSLDFGAEFYQQGPAKKYLREKDSIDPETKINLLGDYLQAKQKDPKVKIETIFTQQGYHAMGN